MRQAISTRYLGATNSRGSRIKALARMSESFSDGTSDPELSLTDGWNCAQNVDENHARVAKLLATKLGWHGLWIAGGSPTNDGQVFVALDGTFSAEFCDRYIIGREDRDWFLLPAPRATPTA